MSTNPQTFIDALIDQIDKAIAKGSVTNVQVAAVLDFLNETQKHTLKNDTEGISQELIHFLKGIEASKIASSNFLSGLSGYLLSVDKDGKSTLEIDNIDVRGRALFRELLILSTSHIGGEFIASPARMKCVNVSEFDAYYRCYFDTGDNNEVTNNFVKDDQARCRVFNGSGAKCYWRLVVGVGTDYIDLSKKDSLGDSIPAIGDNIIQLGNRTDKTRQNAQIISSYGPNAPSFIQYAGIHSYILDGCEKNVLSPKCNRIVGDLSVTSGNGDVLKVPADKGNYINNTDYYYYDRVSHNGALWLCAVEEGKSTTEEPSLISQAWAKQVSEGAQGIGGLSLSIYSNCGIAFRRGSINTTLYAHVTEGGTDISSRIKSYNWYRISADEDADKHWNDAHKAIGQSVVITDKDICGIATTFEFEPIY